MGTETLLKAAHAAGFSMVGVDESPDPEIDRGLHGATVASTGSPAPRISTLSERVLQAPRVILKRVLSASLRSQPLS